MSVLVPADTLYLFFVSVFFLLSQARAKSHCLSLIWVLFCLPNSSPSRLSHKHFCRATLYAAQREGGVKGLGFIVWSQEVFPLVIHILLIVRMYLRV